MIVNRARIFAKEAHTGQKRKISGNPYFNHLENVANTLKEEGFSSSVVAAGFLHDVIEDTPVTHQQLVEEFGTEITQLVLANSENKSLVWEERKAETIKKARTASIEVKALIAADKLDNSQDLLKHYQLKGDEVWNYFNRGYDKQATYYHQLVRALSFGLNEMNRPNYFTDLEKNIDTIFPNIKK